MFLSNSQEWLMFYQIINSYRLLIKDETSEIANYM